MPRDARRVRSRTRPTKAVSTALSLRRRTARRTGGSRIQGNRERGTGLLDNEFYRGIRVWSRLEHRRDTDTRKRVSRLRDPSEHKAAPAPKLLIVSSELWQAAKARQTAQDAKWRERPSKEDDVKGLS